MKSFKAIAVQAAKEYPESYFSEPFTPHEWVLKALEKVWWETKKETEERLRADLEKHLSPEDYKKYTIRRAEEGISLINGY